MLASFLLIRLPFENLLLTRFSPTAIRAGDYYMFDDVDEKFELDMIDDETDFLESEGKISEIDKKIAQRKNILDVSILENVSFQ